MIDYATFLGAVSLRDLRMLNLISTQQRVQTSVATEADAYAADLTRLFTNGLLVRAEREWEMKDGVLWHTFDAVIEPLAVAYLDRMLQERIQINRTPLPTA